MCIYLVKNLRGHQTIPIIHFGYQTAIYIFLVTLLRFNFNKRIHEGFPVRNIRCGHQISPVESIWHVICWCGLALSLLRPHHPSKCNWILADMTFRVTWLIHINIWYVQISLHSLSNVHIKHFLLKSIRYPYVQLNSN